MILEQGAVMSSALPVAEFAAHLRIGTGFGTEALQTGILESHLRAALAMIEGRIGKVLLARRFLWQVSAWRDGGAAQSLPIAPVLSVIEVAIVDGAGGRVIVPQTQWRLRPDLYRPKLEPVGTTLPMLPVGGGAEVILDAGFGPSWATVPADLAQAVLLLAAEFYELRHDGGDGGPTLPRAVLGLIERWRTVRVLGGGGA